MTMNAFMLIVLTVPIAILTAISDDRARLLMGA